MGAWTRTQQSGSLLALLAEAGVPAGPIYRAPEMLDDPHFKARDAIVTTQHPYFGELRMQNTVPKFSETPGSIRTPAPTELRQHNDEVYTKLLGYTAERLAQLRTAKVI